MRTKSRARVAADRAKGMRARKGVAPRPLLVPLRPGVTFSQYIATPGPKIGDDMRRKFALRGQRDLELSKAYTEAQVDEILNRYGPL